MEVERAPFVDLAVHSKMRRAQGKSTCLHAGSVPNTVCTLESRFQLAMCGTTLQTHSHNMRATRLCVLPAALSSGSSSARSTAAQVPARIRLASAMRALSTCTSGLECPLSVCLGFPFSYGPLGPRRRVGCCWWGCKSFRCVYQLDLAINFVSPDLVDIMYNSGQTQELWQSGAATSTMRALECV